MMRAEDAGGRDAAAQLRILERVVGCCDGAAGRRPWTQSLEYATVVEDLELDECHQALLADRTSDYPALSAELANLLGRETEAPRAAAIRRELDRRQRRLLWTARRQGSPAEFDAWWPSALRAGRNVTPRQ
ncbi:hypothetical protein [Tsukamurella hominis]|uniref:hypothetical protein n=1 Tax=Tsukamurella hominis TaxID=1970232 RepID=UPI0039E90230